VLQIFLQSLLAGTGLGLLALVVRSLARRLLRTEAVRVRAGQPMRCVRPLEPAQR
jgi:hypothetical protein